MGGLPRQGGGGGPAKEIDSPAGGFYPCRVPTSGPYIVIATPNSLRILDTHIVVRRVEELNIA